jgi:hypothetical protein
VSPDSLDELRFRRNLQTGVLVVTGLTGLPDLALGASAARSSLGGLRQGARADASAGARAVTQVDDLEIPSGTLVESMEVPPSSAVASAVPEPPGAAIGGVQPSTPGPGMAASPFGDLPPARAPPVITEAQVNAFPDPTDVYKRDVLAGQVRFADGSVLDLGRIDLRLGRGSSSQVYKPADGFVVKFTAPEGTAAERWGYDLVSGLDLQHSSIPRLHQEIPITEGPYAGGMIRVYDEAGPPLGPVERLPGGDLTPGQAQAITDATKELNGYGVVVGDLHSGNLSLTPIGNDRYLVEWFDNGVYLGTDPATASALQTQLLNPGPRYLNQIGPIRLANDLADTFDPLLNFPPGYTTIRPGADAAFPMAPRLGVQSPNLRAVAGAEAPGVAAAGATPPVGAALPGGIPPTPKPTPELSVDLPPSGAAVDPTPRVAIDLPPSAVTSAPTPRLEIEIPPSAASRTGTPFDPFPWTTTVRLSGQALGDAILEADAMRAGAPEPMPDGR